MEKTNKRKLLDNVTHNHQYSMKKAGDYAANFLNSCDIAG